MTTTETVKLARQKVREEILRSAAILRPRELAVSVDAVLEHALPTPIGPELWGRRPSTGAWVQIDDGSHTDEQVAGFEATYSAAGWTELRRTNPFITRIPAGGEVEPVAANVAITPEQAAQMGIDAAAGKPTFLAALATPAPHHFPDAGNMVTPNPAPSGEAVPVAPEGWVLVPREPTEAMYGAAVDLNRAHLQETGVEIGYTSVYRAMLAAAPAAPGVAAEGEAVPVAWVSAAQLAEHVDPSPQEGSEGGNYLPVRVTRAGLFQMPLYAAPPATEAMVERVARAVKPYTTATLFVDELRSLITAALTVEPSNG